jgi:hypothetical protein
MPHPVGPFDDANGEPSRTAAQWLFLMALRQELDVLPDLWDGCITHTRAILATAKPSSDSYVRATRHRNLLDLSALRDADRRLAELDPVVRAGSADPLWRQHRDRAAARALLWDELVTALATYRLTDPDGRRNAWLLEVALDTLRVWSKDYPADTIAAPDDLDWRDPAASIIGPRNRPAPEYRRRQHTDPRPDSTRGCEKSDKRLPHLGPLARDFVWLTYYCCTKEPVHDFAPGVKPQTLEQQVKRAAARAGFDLPSPLRPL